MLRGRNLRREEALGQIVEALGSLKIPGYWQIHTASLRALVGFQEVHMSVDVVVITNAQMYKAICLIFWTWDSWLGRNAI